ncbi:MAG: hypothetical protein AB7F59_03995 [Bdellovibrionales bacterium]
MANCLKCSAQLDGDFGMETCPSCGEINFLDADAPADAPADVSSAPKPKKNEFSVLVSGNPSHEEARSSGEDRERAGGMNEWLADEPGIEPLTPAIEPLESPVSAPFEEETKTGSHAQVRPATTATAMDAPAEPNIEEIADFGNDISSNAADGFLYYDLKVAGIDSKEVRQSVLNALLDKKLGWSQATLEKKIENGTLSFSGLNPMKASQIVKKLRFLDVQITWTQKPLPSSTPEQT